MFGSYQVEVLLVGICLYLLAGLAIAQYSTRPGSGSSYLYITLLWGIFVPVTIFKIIFERDDEDED